MEWILGVGFILLALVFLYIILYPVYDFFKTPKYCTNCGSALEDRVCNLGFNKNNGALKTVTHKVCPNRVRPYDTMSGDYECDAKVDRAYSLLRAARAPAETPE